MNAKLIIFDLDGTLVRGVNGIEIPNRLSEQEFIPGVLERCEQLRADGVKLAIASNQGGVAYGYCAYEQAELRVMEAAKDIGAEWWLMCPYHPYGTVQHFRQDSISRKPNPGMPWELMSSSRIFALDTIFVGDMDSDRMAANNAGVAFQWAKDFFGWEDQP